MAQDEEQPSPSTDFERRARGRSPLAITTPPPLSFATLRQMASDPTTRVSTTMLEAMRMQLHILGSDDVAAELEALYDFETGRPRLR